MARIRGCGGSVIVGSGSTGIVGIKEWTMDNTVDVLDGRGFDDACQPNPVIGMEHWSGNFSGFKDGAPIASTQMFVAVAAQFKESDTTGQVYSGSIIITGAHRTVSVDGLVTYAYDYEGKGTLTSATA